MWTLDSARQWLNDHSDFFEEECGYYVNIVGGVAKKGYSDKDLDLLLTPIDPDMYDFEPIIERFGGDDTSTDEFESWAIFLPDGRIIDLLPVD